MCSFLIDSLTDMKLKTFQPFIIQTGANTCVKDCLTFSRKHHWATGQVFYSMMNGENTIYNLFTAIYYFPGRNTR